MAALVLGADMALRASIAALGLGLGLLALGACTVAPYPVAPPSDSQARAAEEAEQRPQVEALLAAPGAHYFSLCYGNTVNTPGEVLARARELCPYQGRISKVADDFFWNGCALAQPNRVTFLCAPGAPPPSLYQ